MLRRPCAVVFLVVLIVLITVRVDSADYSCTNCFLDLDSGGFHSCAVREDRSLTCWGRQSSGQTTLPDLNPAYFDFIQVSTGGFHTCAIIHCYGNPIPPCPYGNASCWGYDTAGQALPDPNDRFNHISAGRFHTCGLRYDRSIGCWGEDGDGQSSAPLAPAGRQFIQVTAGGYHSCAISECTEFPCIGSNLTCWGRNDDGQTTVPGVFEQYNQVSAGRYHTCAVKTDDSIACWGLDDSGQTTPPVGLFRQVSAGGFHTCGVKTDGSVVCWGYDDSGQSTPPGGSFRHVSAGAYHTCGIRSDGSVTCWGSAQYNQTLPTAGLCGLFQGDFEEGGDCRWSNGSTPCWSPDCDGDGYASRDSGGHCVADMPGMAPAECPTGSWTDLPAGCGAYDCMDDDLDVFAGQESWFSTAYDPGGGTADRFDYNCDGVEQKQYQILSSSLCCTNLGGNCLGLSGGAGCDPYGWDTATVSEVPECGETTDYLVCRFDLSQTCVEMAVQRTQTCR